MKKLAFILIFTLILCMGFTAYAEDAALDTAITSAAFSSEYITEKEVTDPSVTDDATVTDTPTEEVPESNDNFGVWLWDTITSYALEILATLSLTATAIGVALNKKQLFPKLASFMTRVGEFLTGQKDELSDWKASSEATMREWKEKSESDLKEYREVIDSALHTSKEELKQYTEMVTDVLNTVKGLAEEVIKGGKTNELLLRCLDDQEETLNTIVQSSTMAQWKKDIEGQRHAAHVAAMADLQNTDTPTEDGEAS